MKKLLCVILVVCMAIFALTACSGGGGQQGGGGQETGESQENPPVGGETFGAFVYNNVSLGIGADVTEDVLSALGEPKNYTETTSCYFEGLDKTYYYGSFYLYVGAPADAPEYVFAVELCDDTVATAEGLSIGDSKDKVESIYGADGFNGSNQYTIVSNGATLIIQLSGDKVSSIQYHEVGEN